MLPLIRRHFDNVSVVGFLLDDGLLVFDGLLGLLLSSVIFTFGQGLLCFDDAILLILTKRLHDLNLSRYLLFSH